MWGGLPLLERIYTILRIGQKCFFFLIGFLDFLNRKIIISKRASKYLTLSVDLVPLHLDCFTLEFAANDSVCVLFSGSEFFKRKLSYGVKHETH